MAKSESTKIEFGYFHDYESEQFAFYRIPKVLFTDEYFRNLSSDAKVLYGLMLDRMALSIRHQWFDEEGKVYIIFTVEQVIQYMNCGRDKAMKTLAELDTKKGIGLIERVKQGFGKPDSEIARKMDCSTSGVRWNFQEMIDKAGYSCKEDLIAAALESKLIVTTLK